jgi:acyl carrier protein
MSDDLQRIAAIVREVGKIQNVGLDDDIYDAGFSSINALELLMELESAFRVSIPDDAFIRARTPHALHAVVERLRQEQPA